jgi:hypothetical protein
VVDPKRIIGKNGGPRRRRRGTTFWDPKSTFRAKNGLSAIRKNGKKRSENERRPTNVFCRSDR